MTLISLLHFVGALSWAAVIFAAVVGHGSAALRLCGVRRAPIPRAAVAGFGVIIFLGGCLNLLHWVSPAALLLLILIGVFCLLVLCPPAGPRPAGEDGPRAASRWTQLVLSLAALVFLIRLGASVHTPYYQRDDDYNFYIDAPVKMAQLHEFAPDPFSERRIMSSLGGNYFLQAAFLTELPVEDVQMADRALGLLLLVFVASGLGAVFRLRPIQRALLGLLLLITPQLQYNQTFVVLPYALFCGLVYLAADLDGFELEPRLQAFLLGATAAAIASLKSTYLPHGLLFILCVGLLHKGRRGPVGGLRTFLFAVLGCLLVLAPWMVASHAASGTWFYPLLGKGYQYSAYGLFLPPSSGDPLKIVSKVALFNLPLLAVLLVEWFWCERDEATRVLVALTAAAMGASVLVGLATGGDSVRRYSYPVIVPAILLLYLAASHRANLRRAAAQLEWLSALLCVLLAAYVGFNSWTHEYATTIKCLLASVADSRIEPAATVTSYASMEESIPPGPEGALATVDYPFLLDFRSRDIYIADIPGAASLPPGWPSGSDGDALAAYLLSIHRRYLVVSLPAGKLQEVERQLMLEVGNPSSQWILSEDRIRVASFVQYDQLAHSRRRIYDDGRLIVLDLARPAEAPPQ